jgi:hypothetical protein
MSHRHDHHHHGHGDHHHHDGATAPASVMADFGGDIGAAVLYVPAGLAGHEIEIRSMGHAWDGTHVAVRERHLGTSAVWAAFFGSLAAGRYEVRIRDDDARAVELDVCGGGVAEARW